MIDPDRASYFLSTIELTKGAAPTMARWRKRLFIATSYITADLLLLFLLGGYGSIAVFSTLAIVREGRVRRGRAGGR